MRTFGQVPLKVWRDKSFKKLTNDGKMAVETANTAGLMPADDSPTQ